MSQTDRKIHQFILEFFKAKEWQVEEQTDGVVTVKYPDQSTQQYTYLPAVARERKIPLLSTGSPAFQQILKESLANGILSQVQLKPKGDFEAVVRGYFKDAPVSCGDCETAMVGEEENCICVKPHPCFHQINNAKIAAVHVGKSESARYFLFYYSVVFHSKLRDKNEETITILADEKGNITINEFNLEKILTNPTLEVSDFKGKLKPEVYMELKSKADQSLSDLLKEKVALFDLPLTKEKNAKLKNFEKRLRRERREQVISKKHDFDFLKWQNAFEALLKREEESYTTSISVKFINLLVINTVKTKCQITLENKATIDTSLVLGVTQNLEVACPICKKTFTEGYATQDGLYVCGNCTKQSVDTGKIYSKKAALTLDEKLNEYIEQGAGFVCSVCGRKYSKLLEFKCSHDNSSVCLFHYDTCDICGKGFSRSNLTYTDEFRRRLCPKHSGKEQ